MAQKFDPPADIPHDEEFEWVNQWAGSDQSKHGRDALTESAPQQAAADDRPSESVDFGERPRAEATGGAQETDASATAVENGTGRNPVSGDVSVPTTSAAGHHAQSKDDVHPDALAKSGRSGDTAPQDDLGGETLAGLYMSFRGGVLQHMRRILRSEVATPDQTPTMPQGTGAQAVTPPPMLPHGEAILQGKPRQVSGQIEELPSSSDSRKNVLRHMMRILSSQQLRGSASARLSAANAVLHSHIRAHLRWVASGWERRAAVGRERARSVVVEMAPVSPEAETVDSAAIEKAANRLSARGRVLMHLKKVLRSKAAASLSPSADEQIHLPADGSGSTSSSAVALSVRLLVLQHLKNVLRSMRRSVSPVAADATGTPVADEPTVDAVVGPPAAEVPMVTAPMIAPDQFERDIADIVAARDALDAETPAALALAELKRQFARTWSRVFH